jgi:hypothetical protein
VDDPGGDEMQLEDTAPHRDGVTSIITPIEAGREIALRGKPIHDATFALIPPLGTHDDL